MTDSIDVVNANARAKMSDPMKVKLLRGLLKRTLWALDDHADGCSVCQKLVTEIESALTATSDKG